MLIDSQRFVYYCSEHGKLPINSSPLYKLNSIVYMTDKISGHEFKFLVRHRRRQGFSLDGTANFKT